jgi:hypothetical protein
MIIGVHMESTVIEFHLEYNPNRKNPSEIFHAMGLFISSYQQAGQLIAGSIESEVDFEFELKEVTNGCILAKLLLKAEQWTNPDSMIRGFTGEISLPEQVSSITNKEISRLKTEAPNHQNIRIEPYISNLDLALVMEQWSEANKNLLPDEHLKVCKEGNNLSTVVPFDPNFRFTGDPKKMFSRDKGFHNGEEIIEVFRPCNKGASKWDVISTKTGRKYRAEILDKKWLGDYQKSKTRLGGQDYLKVHSSYDVVTVNGLDEIKNAKIHEVIAVIDSGGTQNEIPE